MTGHLINYLQQSPITKQEIDSMAPNPHYVNMLINFSILGTLIYVAIHSWNDDLKPHWLNYRTDMPNCLMVIRELKDLLRQLKTREEK